MRRSVLPLAFALVLALMVGGCSSTETASDSNGSPGSGTAGSDSSAAETGPAPITEAAIQDLLDGDLKSEAWVSSVTGLAEGTMLRRPVVSIGFSDSTARSEAQNALQTALAGLDLWGVLEFLDPEMTTFAPIGSGAIEKVELPATPTSANEFAAWLDSAFGTGSTEPEDWVAHVQSAEYVASLPSGYSDVLAVRTDLAFDHEGQRTAQLIVQAIQVAAPTFARQYVVYYADGDNMTAGDIISGSSAFGY